MANYQLPLFVTTINCWHDQPYNYAPPAVIPPYAPDEVFDGALLFAHEYMAIAAFQFAFLLVPFDTPIRRLTVQDGTGNIVGCDYLEIPAGSGWLYAVYNVERTALGHPNYHWTAVVTPQLSPIDGVIPSPPTGHFLLEDGSDLLLEDGTLILVE